MPLIAKLEKLRGKSAHELRVRSRQAIAQWRERWLSAGARELTDQELLRAFQPTAQIKQTSTIGQPATAKQPTDLDATIAELLARLRDPARTTFFPLFREPEATRTQLRAQFPAACNALIAQADEICAGRFTIFQHENINVFAADGRTIDWQREPLSGKRTPLVHWSQLDFLNPAVAGDKKFTWELSRCQWAITLGQAYWLTGDANHAGNERYATRCIELLTSWLDANPPKRGIHWASSLELAFRIIAWLWALHLLAPSAALTPAFFARLLKSMLAQAEHIETYLSTYFSPNTHLTGEALGLFTLGVALPELKHAAHWRTLGQEILLQQLPIQVRDDGVYFEQASYYHRYTTDFYTHLLVLARTNQIALPPEVESKLCAAYEHIFWLMRPDGSWPFYGDDDGGRFVPLGGRRADDWRDTLATGATLFTRADWAQAAGAAGEAVWLLGATQSPIASELSPAPTAASSVATAPLWQTKAFTTSGFYVMRTGWQKQSDFLLVDCGQHGVMNCGHAHSDALAFEYAAAGTAWLVDPGTFTYTGDWSLRNEIRSSFSHNTVSVDGLSQAEPRTPFTWGHIAQAQPREFAALTDAAGTVNGWRFAGQQNGFARLADPVRHIRTLEVYSAPLAHLRLADRFEAKAEHRYGVHFHFAAGSVAMLERVETDLPDCVLITAANGEQLLLAARSEPQARPVRFTIAEGWVSRSYGHRERAAVVNLEAVGTGNVTLESICVLLTQTTRNAVAVRAFVAEWQRAKSK